MVGDYVIMLLLAQLKNSDEYDELDDALVRISNACGHICYLQKTILIYGFTEVRQTHALRGVNIARDQIMVISSEKPRKTDDVQSYLVSFVGVLHTKIWRGFPIELAWRLFWFISLFISLISSKNYTIKDGVIISVTKIYDNPKKSHDTNWESRGRCFIIPSKWFFCLPQTMGRCNNDPTHSY